MRRDREEHQWRRRLSGSLLTLSARKRGEQTGLDTPVVHALNDEGWVLAGFPVSAEANALSPPPGDYERKFKTQRNRRGPAQAAERVVQFDATRRTLPGLDMHVVGKGNRTDPQGSVHRCCMAVVSSCREVLG